MPGHPSYDGRLTNPLIVPSPRPQLVADNLPDLERCAPLDCVAYLLAGNAPTRWSFAIAPGVMPAGQVCRIYTNEYHPEWCNFNYVFSNSAIWNNGGDCAYLSDAQAKTIGEFAY